MDAHRILLLLGREAIAHPPYRNAAPRTHVNNCKTGGMLIVGMSAIPSTRVSASMRPCLPAVQLVWCKAGRRLSCERAHDVCVAVYGVRSTAPSLDTKQAPQTFPLTSLASLSNWPKAGRQQGMSSWTRSRCLIVADRDRWP